MVQISRRAFLQFTASAVVVASTTSLTGSVSPDGSAPAHADVPVPPEFGFTFDDDIYQTGFPSRRMAIEAARVESLASMNGTFRVAQVVRPVFAIPDDLATTAAEWLINSGQLGNELAAAVANANEDLDFEGELEDACFEVERATLGAEGRAALAAALERYGAGDLAIQVRHEADSPVLKCTAEEDQMLDALIADRRLEADLWDAVQRWVTQHDIAAAGNGLKVLDIEEHRLDETLWSLALAPPASTSAEALGSLL